MRIVVASGKGGTGKTTVAVSLALSLVEGAGERVYFLDCDVEEPNAHLFLKPDIEGREEVAVSVPQVREERCTYCGRCAEVCQYHAIAVVGKKVLVFKEICHGCGSCALNCPVEAIIEVPHPIGVIEVGRAGDMPFAHGILNIGEPMATPLIRRLKEVFDDASGVTIVDAPPGTSCPVVEAMRGSDFALLVTEPTPFGLHDLALAVEVTEALGIPAGVVVNRDGIGDEGVDRYCAQKGVPILMRIPFDRRIAEAYAHGTPLVRVFPSYKEALRKLFERLRSH